MMSPILAGVLGAVLGLAIAAFANFVLLPFVLSRQDKTFADGYRLPVLGWGKQRLADTTRLVYRFLMPLLFAFVGAVTGVQILGGSQ